MLDKDGDRRKNGRCTAQHVHTKIANGQGRTLTCFSS